MKRDYREYVLDIITSIEHINRFTEGLTTLLTRIKIVFDDLEQLNN